MSLYAYDKYDIEEGIINRSDIIVGTSAYFDDNIKLKSEYEEIVKFIDNASIIDENFVSSNLLLKGVVSRTRLSAGCKVAICVTSNPKLLFDTRACGWNALLSVLKLKNGNVLIHPILMGNGAHDACDIVYKQRHFGTVYEFYLWRNRNGFSK